MRLIKRFLRSDLDVVEIGSNIGATTAQICRRLDPGRRIICVEPNPALIETLRRNIASHCSRNEVFVQNAAIHYGSTQVSLRVEQDSRGTHIASENATFSIPAMTLSSLLQISLVDDDYALVLDIEGAEAEIFAQDARALTRCQLLIVELHDDERGASIRESLDRLTTNLGFRVVATDGSVFALDRESRGNALGEHE